MFLEELNGPGDVVQIEVEGGVDVGGGPSELSDVLEDDVLTLSRGCLIQQYQEEVGEDVPGERGFPVSSLGGRLPAGVLLLFGFPGW